MTRAQGLSDFASGLGDTLKVDGGNNRVGINSTAPTEALDVVGNVKVSGSISGGSFTGIDVTSLKDSGGSVKVQANTSGAVVTGVVTAASGSFTGNVSVGGTLTYEDVTNIDSVGIVTARTGVEVTANGLVVNAGVSTFAADVSIADKIIHTGDTDTAIRFPANDTFTVETGGSERVRITSSGKVGIDDTSPENTLSIKNIGSFDGDANSFYFGSNFTGTGANFSGSGKHAQRFFFNNASSNGYLRYDNTGGTGNAGDPITWQERFRITSSGIALFKAGLAEKVNVKTQLTSANDCAITDGNVILTTGNEPGNTYPNITGVHSVLSSGEGFSVTIALKVNGSGTINGFYIDGQTQTIEWSGGSAPSAGSSGYDVFTFSAFKTGSGATDYTVFGAATNHD